MPFGATRPKEDVRSACRIAGVGVGGLSGSTFREIIDIEDDRIAADGEDAWNRKVLDLMERGDVDALIEACPQYAQQARVDMGFKHFAFVLGGLGKRLNKAPVHGYGPLYGTGGAVVEFHV